MLVSGAGPTTGVVGSKEDEGRHERGEERRCLSAEGVESAVRIVGKEAIL